MVKSRPQRDLGRQSIHRPSAQNRSPSEATLDESGVATGSISLIGGTGRLGHADRHFRHFVNGWRRLPAPQMTRGTLAVWGQYESMSAVDMIDHCDSSSTPCRRRLALGRVGARGAMS